MQELKTRPDQANLANVIGLKAGRGPRSGLISELKNTVHHVAKGGSI